MTSATSSALQESSVVAMADGFARATGRAAFCNLHSAVGIGHALGSVFTAYRNQTPLVISAGQQARSLLSGQPFLGATEAANFPKPYVKWSSEPARAEDVPAALAHAYYTAMQRPCGPTFVSVPMDDWGVADRSRRDTHRQPRCRARSRTDRRTGPRACRREAAGAGDRTGGRW